MTACATVYFGGLAVGSWRLVVDETHTTRACAAVVHSCFTRRAHPPGRQVGRVANPNPNPPPPSVLGGTTLHLRRPPPPPPGLSHSQQQLIPAEQRQCSGCYTLQPPPPLARPGSGSSPPLPNDGPGHARPRAIQGRPLLPHQALPPPPRPPPRPAPPPLPLRRLRVRPLLGLRAARPRCAERPPPHLARAARAPRPWPPRGAASAVVRERLGCLAARVGWSAPRRRWRSGER